MQNCVLLFFLLACSHHSKLLTRPVPELLSSIKVEGEGRGRLGIDDQNHVFSFESFLKDGNDWVLAAQIPLRGEDVLIISDIRDPKAMSPSEWIKNKKFLRGARTLLRFALAEKLGLERICADSVCRVQDDEFKVKIEKELLTVSFTQDDNVYELVAENLTGPIFKRTNFYLKAPSQNVSLELFWK
jgi:hypothetical protein